MFQIPLEDIVKRIKEERGLEEEKIMEMIERKVSELKGLVTREGAAHIVANELGVQLLEDMGRKELQLKNLIPGLRNVTVVGRVLRVFEGREWQKGDRKGKVASFIIVDGTGRTRVTIWDK
ncbi:replication factor A, partial [Nanoarchaeota archaeon]